MACNRNTLVSRVSSMQRIKNIQLFLKCHCLLEAKAQEDEWVEDKALSSQTLLCLVFLTHSDCRMSVSNVHFHLYNLKTSRNKYPLSLYCFVLPNKIAISVPEALVSIGSLLICIIMSDLGFDRRTREKLVLQRIDAIRPYPCQRPATSLFAQACLLGRSEEKARSE